MTAGVVSIVGAGPGALDLLTLRARRRLRQADLVLYDGLVPRALARLAPRARLRSVSRRPGSRRVSPACVVDVMIAAARKGERVVRLRGGDGFVLGRGGEEALGLAEAGVRFEIVPGVTSAVAAPGLAGIPVTHRGVASGFVVVSGHAPDTCADMVGGLAPGALTIVVLMGMATRAALATRLVERGWPADLPAAIVVDASRRGQSVRALTLGEMARDRVDAAHAPPGVIVIGRVVDVGAILRAAATVAPRATDDGPGQSRREAARPAADRRESEPFTPLREITPWLL